MTAFRTPSWLAVFLFPACLLLALVCSHQVGNGPARLSGSRASSPLIADTNRVGSPDNHFSAPPKNSPERLVFVADSPAHPFPKRVKAPEFPSDMEWLNTKPLKLKDLKGKFVIFDFWTYCCINCMHILPELKKLEHEFANELVVIGVHSAKFDTEKDTDNIREAILRYEIEHPVVNDSRLGLWNKLGIDTWPTICIIDPEGFLVERYSGEFTADSLKTFFKSKVLPYYRKRNLISEEPISFDLEAGRQPPTPLRFPGKVLADDVGQRLFIADSNHNRIVVTQLDGKLLDVIGSGRIGSEDGGYSQASFNHPQGLALDGDKLYVADTENHRLRQVDLKAQTVRSLAGVGIQGKVGILGGKPRQLALNSPWDLWIHEDALYIAMAGPHQIWKMPLDESRIFPYAGNAKEDVVDGPLMSSSPFKAGFASFAQPSGLTSDGEWLYVADSEGSSIRAVPFDPRKQVRTLVGTARLPDNRLFTFGDRDGARNVALLQHCLGVTYVDGKIYVADTYNNKLRVVDAKTGETKTLAGRGQNRPGQDDATGTFNEPAGISHARGVLYIADTNNHLIRTYDLVTKEVGTLTIEGLTPPALLKSEKPDFAKATHVKTPLARISADEDELTLKVKLVLPSGFKINPLLEAHYWLEAPGDGPLDRTSMGKRTLPKPVAEFEIPLRVTGTGPDVVTVSLRYAYCSAEDDGNGVCKFGAVVFTVPLTVAADGAAGPITLRHVVAN